VDHTLSLHDALPIWHGTLIRADKGTTGIDKITAELKKQMKGDLGEKVETVYADVYFYPLGLAILLLIVEALLGEAPRRVFVQQRPPPASKATAKLRRALGKKEAKRAAS